MFKESLLVLEKLVLAYVEVGIIFCGMLAVVERLISGDFWLITGRVVTGKSSSIKFLA